MSEEDTFTRDLVSVIIPTYNDDKYLQRAVDSVLTQTYDEIEIIIVDSAESTVGAELSSEFPFVKHIHAPPAGPAAARNAGIEHASGEYIAFLDADDRWLQNKLAVQISHLTASGAEFVFSEQYVVDADGSRQLVKGITLPDDEPAHEYYFRKGTGIGSRTVLVHRNCLENHRFEERLQAREDPHLWTRLLRDHGSVKVHKPLAVKYARSDSLTSDTELVWENEKKSVRMLADEYPELRQYRDQRLAEADYRFAKRLLNDGANTRARQILEQQQPARDIRVTALLLVTFLPCCHRQTIAVLERLIDFIPV